MKSIILFIFLQLTMLIPLRVLAQSGDSSVTLQMNKLLDAWHRAAARADLEGYIGIMSPDGIYIGTDPGERWTTSEFEQFCKPYFSKGRSWNFNAFERHIDLNEEKSVAWFDELLDTHMGICRGSGVIRRYGDQWKIEQYVLSATIPNNLMKGISREKGAPDTLFMMQKILEKYGLQGTVILYEPGGKGYFGYHEAKWDSGYLPASTFKIPNSLAGLETGVIDTGYLFRWNGEKRRLPQWEHDMNLKEAFRLSCVPCYQEVARRIGSERMKEVLQKMGYPGMDVSSDNIDLFWLEGTSRITPRQQVNFLRQLYEDNLPLKPDVMKSVKQIMMLESTEQYRLFAKTGWAIRNGNNYGWFVGWIETNGRVVCFATLVEPVDPTNMTDFAGNRKQVTMEMLSLLGVITMAD